MLMLDSGGGGPECECRNEKVQITDFRFASNITEYGVITYGAACPEQKFVLQSRVMLVVSSRARQFIL